MAGSVQWASKLFPEKEAVCCKWKKVELIRLVDKSGETEANSKAATIKRIKPEVKNAV